jgi:hypothetical protein
VRQEERDGLYRPGFDNHDDVLALRNSCALLSRAQLSRNAPNASPHGDTRYGTAAVTLSF